MSPTGGFFGLEIKDNNTYHRNALLLTSGRACLNVILEKAKIEKIYVPFYTCDALLAPILNRDIKYEFYPINEFLDPVISRDLKKNEYILYINYFGLKNSTVKNLINKHNEHLIVDNCQAFFENQYKGIWSFNSARKFFGVSDGAFLYSPKKMSLNLKKNTNLKYNHLINRNLGNLNIAYKQYQENEKLQTFEIKGISPLSEVLLNCVNYDYVKKKRRENFSILRKKLDNLNTLKMDNIDSVPFCYPFLPKKTISKEKLIKKQIFIPTFWKDVLKRKGDYQFENKLARELLPLPVDHRYAEKEMNYIAETLRGFIK